MKIAVLGTGMVGRALAAKCVQGGHDVVIGTRDVQKTLARVQPDSKGTDVFVSWHAVNSQVGLLEFADAGAFAEVIVNATAGAVSLQALDAVGEHNLNGKVLMDLAVPLDYSQGRPPKLAFGITDSLGEQIQRAFPGARVVKTLNTMHVGVMVDPQRVPGAHNVFVAGDDSDAKQIVIGLLAGFGWTRDSIIDLGGIEGARAAEGFVPLLFRLIGIYGYDVNIHVAHH